MARCHLHTANFVSKFFCSFGRLSNTSYNITNHVPNLATLIAKFHILSFTRIFFTKTSHLLYLPFTIMTHLVEFFLIVFYYYYDMEIENCGQNLSHHIFTQDLGQCRTSLQNGKHASRAFFKCVQNGM